MIFFCLLEEQLVLTFFNLKWNTVYRQDKRQNKLPSNLKIWPIIVARTLRTVFLILNFFFFLKSEALGTYLSVTDKEVKSKKRIDKKTTTRRYARKNIWTMLVFVPTNLKLKNHFSWSSYRLPRLKIVLNCTVCTKKISKLYFLKEKKIFKIAYTIDNHIFRWCPGFF